MPGEPGCGSAACEVAGAAVNVTRSSAATSGAVRVLRIRRSCARQDRMYRTPRLAVLGAGDLVGRELTAGGQPGADHPGRVPARVVDVLLGRPEVVAGVDEAGPVREPERLAVRVGRVVEQVLDEEHH